MRVKPFNKVCFCYVLVEEVEIDSYYPDEYYENPDSNNEDSPEWTLTEITPLKENEGYSNFDLFIDIRKFTVSEIIEGLFDVDLEPIRDETKLSISFDNISNLKEKQQWLINKDFEKLHNAVWFQQIIDEEFKNFTLENFSVNTIGNYLDYHLSQYPDDNKEYFFSHLFELVETYGYFNSNIHLKRAIIGWIIETRAKVVDKNKSGVEMPKILKDNAKWETLKVKLKKFGVIEIRDGEYYWMGIHKDNLNGLRVGPKIDMIAMLEVLKPELAINKSIHPAARLLCKFFKNINYNEGKGHNKGSDNSFSRIPDTERVEYFQELLKNN